MGIEEFGFTRTESKLYMTLLELGPSQAGVLSRKSGLHRRIVYDVLDRLIAKGLVGYITENNKKLFTATNPAELQNILSREQDALSKVLPELLAKYEMPHEKNETLFYTGTSGLRTCFNDQLNSGKEILVLGASADAQEFLNFYFKHYDNERKKRKINVKILTRDVDEFKKIPLSEVRKLPIDTGNSTTNIYGNKVVIVHWNKERPFAIMINQKEIADTYRGIFSLLWR